MSVKIQQYITDEQRKNIAQYLASTKPPELDISVGNLITNLENLCKTCITEFRVLINLRFLSPDIIILQTDSIPVDLLKALYYRIPAGYGLEIENLTETQGEPSND